MSESPTDASYSRLFGDYDPPSNERTSVPSSVTSPLLAKLSPQLLLSPTQFSNMHLNGSSNGSEDSEEEYLSLKMLPSSQDFVTGLGRNTTGFGDLKVFDFDSQVISEDEKKRLKNTEAARRCREKVKRRTEELEEELAVQTRKNEAMNQQRHLFLAQIREQYRMLHHVVKRNPSVRREVIQEVSTIADHYNKEVHFKRNQIAHYFATNCHRSY